MHEVYESQYSQICNLGLASALQLLRTCAERCSILLTSRKHHLLHPRCFCDGRQSVTFSTPRHMTRCTCTMAPVPCICACLALGLGTCVYMHTHMHTHAPCACACACACACGVLLCPPGRVSACICAPLMRGRESRVSERGGGAQHLPRRNAPGGRSTAACSMQLCKGGVGRQGLRAQHGADVDVAAPPLHDRQQDEP